MLGSRRVASISLVDGMSHHIPYKHIQMGFEVEVVGIVVAVDADTVAAVVEKDACEVGILDSGDESPT